jgi:hypothetical protein
MPHPTQGTAAPVQIKPRAEAVALLGTIRAAVTANLQIDEDMDPAACDLIRNAVDGLLEAAELMAKRLARALDMAEGEQ